MLGVLRGDLLHALGLVPHEVQVHGSRDDSSSRVKVSPGGVELSARWLGWEVPVGSCHADQVPRLQQKAGRVQGHIGSTATHSPVRCAVDVRPES